MSYHQALKQSCFALGALALLLVSSEGLSYGDACSPASPCPCAADGVCRPNRLSFGYSKTRWRPWPGDPVEQQATPDAAGVPDSTELKPLNKFERPLPEEEGLRQPYKEKREKKEEAAAGQGPEALGPAGEGPAVEGDEGDDPFGQGTVFPLPNGDDSPPALPASLRQAALAFNMPWETTNPVRLSSTLPTPLQSPIANVVVPVKPTNQVAQAAPLPVNNLPVDNKVVPASFQTSHSISLINPASAIVSSPESLPLQQAIYYEKSTDENINATNQK